MAEYEPQLRAAAQRGNASLLQSVLTQKGININSADGLGNTALHYSAHHDHPATLEMLLEAGADPNVQNTSGDTPLHKAIAKNSIPCIKALIEHGANPKTENKEKKTPERMAKSKEVKELLKNAKKTSVPVVEVDKDMLADAGDFDD